MPTVSVDDLRNHVAAEIGAIAKPKAIFITPDLPKTRSGKIMRRLLRDVAEGRNLGDTSTLADAGVVSELQRRAAAGGRMTEPATPTLHATSSPSRSDFWTSIQERRQSAADIEPVNDAIGGRPRLNWSPVTDAGGGRATTERPEGAIGLPFRPRWCTRSTGWPGRCSAG